MYLIVDQAFLSRYGLGFVKPFPVPFGSNVRSEFLKSGKSVAYLARSVDIDVRALEATVARWNKDVTDGKYKAFGKGTTSYNRFNGDPDFEFNPYLAPIATGPFYSVEVVVGDLSTFAGLRADRHSRVNVDFFWLAVHCLEKYFKAALLMNERSSNNFGHDIVRLYDAVLPLAPELLISAFNRPDNMPASMWRDETVLEFLTRLYQDGNAHNRYLIYGYVRKGKFQFSSTFCNSSPRFPSIVCSKLLCIFSWRVGFIANASRREYVGKPRSRHPANG